MKRLGLQRDQRDIVRSALLLWLATRVAFVAVTYFAVLLQAPPPAVPSAGVTPGFLLGAWNRLDVQWYIAIAQHGYWAVQPTAFFPLYPILLRAAAFLFFGHYLLAGMVVSNLGVLAACVGLGLLAAHDGKPEDAARAIRIELAYPLAFFALAAYADSLLLAFITFALYAARTGKWRWAAALALLAGLTRPTTLALLLPLLWEYGRQHGWWQQSRWQKAWQTWRQWVSAWWASVRTVGVRWTPLRADVGAALEPVMVAGAVPVALAIYAAFCWLRFGDPLAFAHAQQYWGRVTVAPWTAIGLAASALTAHPLLSNDTARTLVDLAPAVLFLVLTLAAVRRMPVAYTLYMLGTLYFALGTPRPSFTFPFAATGRYLLPAIPMFLLLARWSDRRPWLDFLLVGGGFALQAIFTAIFITRGAIL
ncbi:MAG TPA: hypothetical protein VKT52_05860 [Ktedonobacterales bacterium]|nr:hypothetical protein [Ktedonobacterales bacterium]